MLEKLKLIEEKYEELEARMLSPELYNDPTAMSRAAREQKELAPLVETYREYVRAENTAKEALELISSSTDKELKALAQEEYESATASIDELKNKLRLLLIPKDPNDDKNVIVEIRAGVGGDEAALFAGSLLRMYTMYAERCGWKLEITDINETELGGVKEVSFIIEGEGAYSRLKFESGVHRVQRVPDTEAGGRIHTSTVTVAVLPEVDEVELQINPNDLQIDTYRSSGAGGQHVNKTESAIRITHIPTGLVVECQDERSQYKNKDRAMKILRAKLYDMECEKQNAEIAAERKSQVGMGMRNERIRTYNFPQGRVTDHRIGLTLYKIDSVMNGDLNELIDALITADQAEKLRTSEEN